MKLKVVVMIILVIMLSSCKEYDKCIQREVFNECLDKVDNVNSSAIYKCKEASLSLSLREKRKIRERCR